MKRSTIFPIVVLTPILLWFFVFVSYPLIYSIYSSFFLWIPEKPFGSTFVGISNYIKLFTIDPTFMISLKNTLIYVALKTSVVVVIGIIIAMLLKQVRRLQRFYIYLIFLPFLCLPSAIGVLFTYLYQPTFGLFNSILQFIGLPSQGFLSNPSQALYCVIAVDIIDCLD